MNKEELRSFVENNPKLVKMKDAGNGLFVLKYSKKVFFGNLWNEYLEECRGTVIDKDFNVVTRPFTKIYNLGVESRCPVFNDDELVHAYRKVNGFMVAVSHHNNELLVSTTGSLGGDYVEMAKEKLALCNVNIIKEHAATGSTILFECVHENDPHIIPEETGLYLLGDRVNSWESTMAHMGHPYCAKNLARDAKAFGCHAVEHSLITVGQLKELSKKVKHEGFVFYAEDGRAAKIKSPYYLTKKAFARKKDIMSFNRELVDEEYYPLVEYLLSIKGEFNALDEQARLTVIRNYLEA